MSESGDGERGHEHKPVIQFASASQIDEIVIDSDGDFDDEDDNNETAADVDNLNENEDNTEFRSQEIDNGNPREGQEESNLEQNGSPEKNEAEPVPGTLRSSNDPNIETLTLSSDDEDTVYSSNQTEETVNHAMQVKTENDQYKQIDDYIQSLLSNSSEPGEAFENKVKSIHDDLVCCNSEVSELLEQCQDFQERFDKLSIKETHIFSDGVIDPHTGSLSVDGEAQRIVKIDAISRKVSGNADCNEDEDDPIDLGPLSPVTLDPEINVIETVTGADTQAKYKLPMVGPIVRRPLGVGDLVFAVSEPNQALVNKWLPAKIIGTRKIGGIQSHYDVKYEDPFIPPMMLKGTQLAYRATPAVMLSIKNRVIAYYPSNPKNPDDPNSKILLSGLIAETAGAKSVYRYLVFFDNGSVAYVPCDSVFLIAEETIPFLEDVPVERRPFLRKYFKDYPERALVKYQKEEKDYVHFDNKWVAGRVKLIDCSLVQFYFPTRDLYEWIYRGSPRLKPLSNLLESLEELVKKRAIRKALSQPVSKNKAKPFVQYFRGDENLDETKKSPTKADAVTRHRGRSRTEFLKFPELFAPPIRLSISNLFTPHRCSEDCINLTNEDINRYRDINPYSVPIICGWDRQFSKKYSPMSFKLRKKREVSYIAPCGRRLRNIEEVDRYLEITKSGLAIDLFSFHPKLKLYSELNGSRTQGCFYYEPDVTGSTENHSISCINWVSEEPITPGFKYWPTRFPGRGIKLDLDPHFLVCCDCVDNCRDKTKCECRLLGAEAFEAVRCVADEQDDTTFRFRRLETGVNTGLWECNPNCACNANCANRVVQNGIRIQLQIFRTEKKGWGIRALHDIPPGAFICVYAAEVLNEDLANEHGHNYGDEYLADLDYIEMIEQIKYGFEEVPCEEISSDEEDSISPSTSEPDSDTAYRRSNRKKKSKNSATAKKPKKERPKRPRKPLRPLRDFFGETSPYSLDAKRKGNVGRYFNHSCDPNCFVQNVFIDTHDLRFPWVALFTMKFVPAFTELTWNYNYEIIEGRKTWCHCGASNCRGRLL